VGEIHIGGASLAEGYLGDPRRTADRFVRHPRTGERLYRTGDLGRYRPDGEIEILGRADRQVKVRGHRIELGEVEHALAEHPAVDRCVVVVEGEQRQRASLRAFVVAKAGSDLQIAEVLAHLRDRLPAYMVPPRVERCDSLPLTDNGKVDRAGLASRARPAPPVAGAEGTEPTELAARVLARWAAELDRPVGPDDDFFALGGDSLIAARIVGELLHYEAVAGRTFDELLVLVLEERTVRGFTARASATAAAAPSAVTPGEPAGTVDEVVAPDAGARHVLVVVVGVGEAPGPDAVAELRVPGAGVVTVALADGADDRVVQRAAGHLRRRLGGTAPALVGRVAGPALDLATVLAETGPVSQLVLVSFDGDEGPDERPVPYAGAVTLIGDAGTQVRDALAVSCLGAVTHTTLVEPARSWDRSVAAAVAGAIAGAPVSRRPAPVREAP
jgi:pyochelin synthetase